MFTHFQIFYCRKYTFYKSKRLGGWVMVVLLFKEAILTYGPKTLSLVVIHGRVDFFPQWEGKLIFHVVSVRAVTHFSLIPAPHSLSALVSFCFKSGSASVSEDEKKKKNCILSRVMLVKRLRGNLCSSFTGRKGGIWGEGGGVNRLLLKPAERNTELCPHIKCLQAASEEGKVWENSFFVSQIVELR